MIIRSTLRLESLGVPRPTLVRKSAIIWTRAVSPAWLSWRRDGHEGHPPINTPGIQNKSFRVSNSTPSIIYIKLVVPPSES